MTIEELKTKIIEAKQNNEKHVYFTDPQGVERIFFVTKHGGKWIEKATLNDILRVSPR